MIQITEDEIKKNWKKEYDNKPLVSIENLVYNHEKYIAQALDGFLMQKTDFPFEVIVHDDASTDNSAQIIRKYEKKFPSIIKPIYETENQYSKHDGSLGRIVNSKLSGKYIALCEGDDYWIDENKLQMQVDFLENNPEYGMCYTKAKPYNQSMQKFNKKSIGADFDGFEDLLKNGNRIPTLTTVYRKDLLDKYQKEIQPGNKGWLMGDYPMWLYFSHESKVKFFDKVTAVYRVLENSASHSVDVEKQFRFEKSNREIRQFYANKYNIIVEFEDDVFIRFYIYVNMLKKKYDANIAKLMRIEYRKSNIRNIKMFVYYVCSRFSILFKCL